MRAVADSVSTDTRVAGKLLAVFENHCCWCVVVLVPMRLRLPRKVSRDCPSSNLKTKQMPKANQVAVPRGYNKSWSRSRKVGWSGRMQWGGGPAPAASVGRKMTMASHWGFFKRKGPREVALRIGLLIEEDRNGFAECRGLKACEVRNKKKKNIGGEMKLLRKHWTGYRSKKRN